MPGTSSPASVKDEEPLSPLSCFGTPSPRSYLKHDCGNDTCFADKVGGACSVIRNLGTNTASVHCQADEAKTGDEMLEQRLGRATLLTHITLQCELRRRTSECTLLSQRHDAAMKCREGMCQRRDELIKRCAKLNEENLILRAGPGSPNVPRPPCNGKYLSKGNAWDDECSNDSTCAPSTQVSTDSTCAPSSVRSEVVETAWDDGTFPDIAPASSSGSVCGDGDLERLAELIRERRRQATAEVHRVVQLYKFASPLGSVPSSDSVQTTSSAASAFKAMAVTAAGLWETNLKLALEVEHLRSSYAPVSSVESMQQQLSEVRNHVLTMKAGLESLKYKVASDCNEVGAIRLQQASLRKDTAKLNRSLHREATAGDLDQVLFETELVRQQKGQEVDAAKRQLGILKTKQQQLQQRLSQWEPQVCVGMGRFHSAPASPSSALQLNDDM
eukprot:gnl/MRDRNA2_/MRDRNA2_97955_c0_seq1.p1 gnl/MRDRNA2_/MRDRNA2_97955_c0~~gnl/MRDRNA2_/MRDRNA2_97955_c0_seq1.p1  ORF type:complete len:444 (+),score=74.41 gnl/MRDRNA2_/MRDRNA2_97955_c0_seq1:78-1409(+)